MVYIGNKIDDNEINKRVIFLIKNILNIISEISVNSKDKKVSTNK